jgi:hypothetical protein
MNEMLIAPCGMNCALCSAFLREKNKCSGCRGDKNKPTYCVSCKIVNCEILAATKSNFCYECPKFCQRLKQLDKRYSTRYSMSMLENLKSIQTAGMSQFLAAQKKRWTCPDCGKLISVHYGYCVKCKKPE